MFQFRTGFRFRPGRARRQLSAPLPPAIIEQVEPKVMLSGDVTASLTNGHLKIVGDTEGNDLVVNIASDGTVSFTSNSTTINGSVAASVSLTGTVESIAINMQAGADTLIVQGVGGATDTPGSLPTIAGDVIIQMGADTDTFTLRGLNIGGRVYLAGNGGEDRLTVEALEVTGEFIVAGNRQNDNVSVRNLIGGANVNLRGGGEVDTLSAGDNIAPGSSGSLVILSGGGDDTERTYPEEPADPDSETTEEQTERENLQALINNQFNANPHGQIGETLYRDWAFGGSAFADDFPAFDASQFQTTSSGLQFRIIEAGTGSNPTTSDTVTTHYQGLLVSDGTQFDSSYDRGAPSSFGLNQVIDGWTEGLQLIATGGRIQLLIPPDLGYGATGQGSIPANATLFFNIELRSIA